MPPGPTDCVALPEAYDSTSELTGDGHFLDLVDLGGERLNLGFDQAPDEE